MELELQNLLMQVKIVKLVYHGEFHTQCQGPNFKLKTIKKYIIIFYTYIYKIIPQKQRPIECPSENKITFRKQSSPNMQPSILFDGKILLRYKKQ